MTGEIKMAKFKIGDLIEAVHFDGATGKLLLPSKIYRISKVATEEGCDGYLLTLEGEYIDGKLLKAYSRRFKLHNRRLSSPGDLEYEEIMEFERLVNG